MNANRTHFLLLATFSLIFFGMINLFMKAIPLTLAHAIYFCQKSISASTITFPHTIPFTVLLLLSSIFLIGLTVLVIQLIKTKLFVKGVLKRQVLFPKKLKPVACELDIQSKIDVIQDSNNFSFCYGILRPRICLSTGLIENLNKTELQAVLLHESYHLKNHDPLRILLGKPASLMLFFIPTLKDIQAHYTFSKEIAADEVVVRSGGRESLISALTKLLSPGTPSLSGVAAFADSYDLEKRILYLTEQNKAFNSLSKRNLLLSFSAVLLLFIVLSSPVHAVAMSDKTMDHAYFICPFGGDCINSCKKDIETMSSKNFSEELPYTPIK